MTSRAQVAAAHLRPALAGVLAPEQLAPRAVERTGFDIAALDALADGGAPIGAITELVGPASSGRTTAALGLVAAHVAAGSVCAWVDAADALQPESVAASGVDLTRLLWVRCGDRAQQVAEEPAAPRLTLQVEAPAAGSSQRISEDPHIPPAVRTLMEAHGGLYDRQVRRERQNDTVALIPRCSEPLPRRAAQIPSRSRMPVSLASSAGERRGTKSSLWNSLDQALRATDLLLQNGGFAAIVLDLGSTPAEFAWRIPLATWFRYRAACERTRASLLLLTQHPCARSSAGLVLRLHPASLETSGKVMTGASFQAEVERSRFANQPQPQVISIRKPPQPERPGRWKGKAVWA